MQDRAPEHLRRHFAKRIQATREHRDEDNRPTRERASGCGWEVEERGADDNSEDPGEAIRRDELEAVLDTQLELTPSECFDLAEETEGVGRLVRDAAFLLSGNGGAENLLIFLFGLLLDLVFSKFFLESDAIFRLLEGGFKGLGGRGDGTS